MRMPAATILLLCILGLSACAGAAKKPLEENLESQSSAQSGAAADQTEDELPPTVVSYQDYPDPMMGFNRAVFAFNDISYRYVLIPASRTYRWLLPQAVRDGVGRVFSNLKAPVYAINHLLQGRPRELGVNLARFGLNSTLGLLGIFDPAAAWFGLQPARTSFDQSLGRYAVGEGAYLVLPLLGPSYLRAAPAVVVDQLLHPLPYLMHQPEASITMGFDRLQSFGDAGERYLILREESDDPYVFFRNMKLQELQRDAQYPADE